LANKPRNHCQSSEWVKKEDGQIYRVHDHPRKQLLFSDALIIVGRGVESRRRRGGRFWQEMKIIYSNA